MCIRDRAIVEARILTLENQLKNVKIVAKSDNKGTVSIGSFVTIRDVEFGDEMTYRIISSVESNNDMSTITDAVSYTHLDVYKRQPRL